MPGYNHYSWCMCGWCYKSGSNGYSSGRATIDFDKSYAERTLKKHGADRSWTACFVNPNAYCPVCSARVYYYENAHGSRVFFDELGWPWPKHPCTDNARILSRRVSGNPEVPATRKRGMVTELMEAAKVAEFDPNARFRIKYHQSPFDLLQVMEVTRVGFENLIKSESISPTLDEPVYLSFTSEKLTVSAGDFFSYDGTKVYFLNPDTFEARSFRAKTILPEEFALKIAGSNA